MLNILDVMNMKRLHVLGNKISLWLFGFYIELQGIACSNVLMNFNFCKFVYNS